MIALLLVCSLFVSAFTFPWYVTFVIAAWYLAEGGTVYLVIFAGLVIDMLSAAPVASLGGFTYVATTYAVILAFVTMYLRKSLFA